MLRFTPKSEEDLDALLKAGIYEFIVYQAIEKTSKKGNPMIELVLKVWGNEGREYYVYDYLMSHHPVCELKVRRFSQSTGIFETHYQKGQIGATDCLNKGGRVNIGIEEPKESGHQRRNVVVQYVPKVAENINSNNTANSNLDDDVPF